MAANEMYNYIQIDERVSTAGMPAADQLRAAAAEGFTGVINLATDNPEHALPGEGELVRSLGMAYTHIPVDWGNPTTADFAAFEQAMARHRDDRLLIHCVANYRVTAFYSLYACKHLGWTVEQAAALRARVWDNSDYPVWETFIAEQQNRINQELS